MPGLCGAIKLRGSCGKDHLDSLVSAMLSAMHREPFYVAKRWSCPTGRASFASLGLESLQAALPAGAETLQGLVYGRPRFPADIGRHWLAEVSGPFSMALFDRFDGSYVVAADRKSSEPVFYAEVNGVLCFAPEAGVLASLPGVRAKADYAAIGSLIVSGHLIQDRTLFRDVHKLEGGKALRADGETYQRINYWQFAPGGSGRMSQGDLLERLDTVLGRAVETDVTGRGENAAIFLSGGYDSRVILGYAQRFPPVRTVSWGLEEDRPESDAEIARRLALTCRTHHVFMKRDPSDFGAMFEETSRVTESQSDVAAFHPQEFRLMRQLKREGISCVVRGDETFGWKKMSFSVHGALAVVGLRYFGSVEGLSGFFVPAAAGRLSEESVHAADKLRHGFDGWSANQIKDFVYFTQRVQHYLNSCAVLKQSLLEHANPLLADEVLDFLSLVPDSLRVEKKLLRLLLARRFPDLHAVNYAGADGLENWPEMWRTETVVREYLSRHLSDSASGVWEIYDRAALRRVFDARTDFVPYSSRGWLNRAVTRGARDLVKPFSRSAADYLQAQLALRAPISTTKLLFRFLVVKHWIDRFSPSFD